MVKTPSTPTLVKLISALLIVLWIYAAGSKLADISSFKRGLYNQPLPSSIIKIFLYAIPLSEIFTTILLIFPKSNRMGLYLSAVLLFSFSLYIAFFLLNLWSYIPCSCGGILESMGWKTHLIFNLFFLSIAIYAIYLKRKEAIGTA